jgi:hypothetical protein
VTGIQVENTNAHVEVFLEEVGGFDSVRIGVGRTRWIAIDLAITELKRRLADLEKLSYSSGDAA